MHLLLRSYVATAMAIVTMRDRVTHREEGQTALEYVGILLIVGLIIAAITALGVPGQVGTKVTEALGKIFGGT